MNLAITGFYGSIFVLIILLMRFALRRRLIRRVFVILWDIAAVRFLLPWELPSFFSIYRLFPNPPANMGAGVILPPAQPVISAQTVTAAATSAGTPAAELWPVIWAAGALLCAGIFAALYLRWLPRFRTSLPLFNEYIRVWLQKHPLRRRIDVRYSEYITAPLTYGILRPVILLPKAMIPEDTESLEYILTHEYIHIRRFDAVRKLLYMAAACAAWYNPLVWIMYVAASRDIEISCDEAVVTTCSSTRYARLLIQLEAQKPGAAVFGSSFSRNAMTERIRAIMRAKKQTVFSLILAGALIICVSTALATSPPQEVTQLTQETVYEEQDLISYVDDDGTTWWSSDGGNTFEPLSEKEAQERLQNPEIEWWTEEEYAAWLEEEKVRLQALLGTEAWTNTAGEFTWTQEKIDEAVALYEETLEQIRNGARISRSINGSDADTLIQYADDAAALHTAEYAQFGLEASDDALFYKGERVRYFEDCTELEPGQYAERQIYYDQEGTADIRTVWEERPNADGSMNPFGHLTDIIKIPAKEVEARIDAHLAAEAEDTVVIAAEDVPLETLLAPYTAFGLTYENRPEALRMYWQGKPVHGLYDPQTGRWFANNMNGSDLGSSAVDLEAQYENGRLTGLQEAEHGQTAVFTETAVAEGEEAEPGVPFETIFEQYASLGLQYERISAASTGYNLYYDGKPVNRFADEGPNGSFTFDSADQKHQGITLQVLYSGGKPAALVQK